MPACIRVDSGISVGTRHWIDRPVLRIGSDPSCDICLPSTGLAAHALTIEFRDGVYRAYNRESSAITIGNESVRPGGVATWRDDATITLPGDLRLVLELDDDPRPAPRPDSQFGGDVAETAAVPMSESAIVDPSAAPAQKSSSTAQLAVIGVCILAMAGLLMTRNSGSEAVAADRPTFEAIVRASLDKDDATREVVRRLQYAQAAVVRGHHRLARERFLKLRDQLVHADSSLPTEQQDGMDDILSYVEFQLSQLER